MRFTEARILPNPVLNAVGSMTEMNLNNGISLVVLFFLEQSKKKFK